MSKDLPFGNDTLVIPFTWQGRPPQARGGPRMSRMRRAGELYRNGVVRTAGGAAPADVGAADAPAAHPADTATQPTNTAVPLVDNRGNVVRDSSGGPVMRPSGYGPEFFADQGRLDAAIQQVLLATGQVEVEAGFVLSQLRNFRQSGAWDMQRPGGHFDARFVDYATIAIGIYAAAAKIPLQEILGIQDLYASQFSHFDPTAEMDPNYTHLRAINVENTKLGYELYNSGRVGGTSR